MISLAAVTAFVIVVVVSHITEKSSPKRKVKFYVLPIVYTPIVVELEILWHFYYVAGVN